MNIKRKLNNLCKQDGIVFIMTSVVVFSIIIFLVLSIDLARLYDVKQTLHTQAQLLAEAGLKLRLMSDFKDNSENIEKLLLGYHMNKELNRMMKNLPIMGREIDSEKTMSYLSDILSPRMLFDCYKVGIEKIEVDPSTGEEGEPTYVAGNDGNRCQRQRGFSCEITASVYLDKLIFKKLFSFLAGNGNSTMAMTVTGTSCHNPNAEEIGIYPFYFED